MHFKALLEYTNANYLIFNSFKLYLIEKSELESKNAFDASENDFLGERKCKNY